MIPPEKYVAHFSLTDILKNKVKYNEADDADVLNYSGENLSDLERLEDQIDKDCDKHEDQDFKRRKEVE